MALAVDDVIGSLIKLESLGLVEPPKGPQVVQTAAFAGRAERTKLAASALTEDAATDEQGHDGPRRRARRSFREKAHRHHRGVRPRSALRNSPPPPRKGPPPIPRNATPVPRRSPSPPPRAPQRAPADAAPRPAEVVSSPSTPLVPPTPTASAPFAPSPDVELDPEHQERIASLFGQLDSLDHYAVLGVARGVEKKGIKRAYFQLTAKFHPDRFFRKKLGPFKPRPGSDLRSDDRGPRHPHGRRKTHGLRRLHRFGRAHAQHRADGSADATAEMRRVEATVAPEPRVTSPQPARPSASGVAVAAQKTPSVRPAAPSPPSVSFQNEPATAVSARSSARDLTTIVDDAITRDRPSGSRISVAGDSRRDAGPIADRAQRLQSVPRSQRAHRGGDGRNGGNGGSED